MVNGREQVVPGERGERVQVSGVENPVARAVAGVERAVEIGGKHPVLFPGGDLRIRLDRGDDPHAVVRFVENAEQIDLRMAETDEISIVGDDLVDIFPEDGFQPISGQWLALKLRVFAEETGKSDHSEDEREEAGKWNGSWHSQTTSPSFSTDVEF